MPRCASSLSRFLLSWALVPSFPPLLPHAGACCPPALTPLCSSFLQSSPDLKSVMFLTFASDPCYLILSPQGWQLFPKT